MAPPAEEILRQLNRIATAQEGMQTSIRNLEARVDLVRQEVQRANTIIYRLGLSYESAKNALQRQDAALSQLGRTIARLSGGAAPAGDASGDDKGRG